MSAAALAVTGDRVGYEAWRSGERQIWFREARERLRVSEVGGQIDREVAPASVFGGAATSWSRNRYSRLCAYAHSQPGYNNSDFWQSNGPVYSERALRVLETEISRTVALCYLLMRFGWPRYRPGPGASRTW